MNILVITSEAMPPDVDVEDHRQLYISVSSRQAPVQGSAL